MNGLKHNFVENLRRPASRLRLGIPGLSLPPLTAPALAILLGITALLPQAAMASTPPGPCEEGYVAPTPVAVAVTEVPIEVSSTTADYFVLYAKHTLNEITTDIPVSVTRGEDGTTTLSDNLEPLAADQYRVEKYQVANPADVDGDCVDDITELDNLGAYNPINAAKKISPINGVVAIDSHAAFQELAFRGISHESHLDGIGFVKFWIFYPFTDSPEVFFLNTEKHVYHNPFVRSIGYPQEVLEDAVAGQLVWHPNVPAPDGTLGSYRFEWGSFAARSFEGTERVYMMLAAAMPVLEDNLYFYPETTPFFSSYWDEREKFDASRIHILLEHQVLADVDYIALNQAEAYGLLRLMEEDDRPNPYDVAIYKSLPNDLPRVAGTITTVPQTPLSHVNLRAIQNGLPNAFIRDVLKDEAIKPLIGNYVYYAVTGEGYTIRAATKKEVDDHHESLRPQSVQTLQSDLTVTTIASLDDVDFDDWTSYGVKAANVAELTKLSLPAGTTPVGYAVPFYFYDQFMKQATVAEETILGKKKAPDEEKITLPAGTALANAVTQMLAHPYFQTDADIQEEMLDDLRDAIKDATSPKFITDALTAMHAEYPDGQSLRYRSSTNNEDLPAFNGAGLYSSKTQDPDETTADGIDKSIKSVWASLWNYRAFLERDFHRVDHTTVYMGVLVHPNYSDEPVNGVAVSYDPITFQENAYYVNSQMGEDLVTNPEAYSQPEQLLLSSTGDATVLSRSNLAPANQLLMTDAQMRQLRSNLETIHNHFATLYGVQDGDKFAIEIEFKITAANQLAIKQARPWIFAQPLDLTPTVTLALNASQVTEGAGLELTVTRDGGVLSTPLHVGLTWSETRAMLASAKPASVTLPVNQTALTIKAPLDDDREDEHDSVVTVSIVDNSSYVTGNPSSASATVTDDDLPQVGVHAAPGTLLEGATAGFTFTRSGSVLEQPLIVDITVTDNGSRLAGVLPTTVTFAANSATASVSLPTADDSEITPTSVVTLQINAGSAYGIASAGSARVTVQDDVVPGPTLLFAADHAVGGGEVYVLPLNTRLSLMGAPTFTMAGPDTGAFTLYGDSGLLVFNEHNYDPSDDANQDGVYEIDFTAEHSRGGRHGSTTVRLRFTVTNAELIALAEQQWDQTTQNQRATLLPNETTSRLRPAFANLQTDVQAMALRLARQQQLPSPDYTISISANGDIVEGGDASFTVTASPAPTANLDVTVDVSQTGDFGVTPGSQTVTIPTTGSYTLIVATVNDSVDEANGSIMATVSRGNGYLVSWAARAATVAVADDDAPSPTTPEISITGGAGITEGGTATFTVSASPTPHAALWVSVIVAQSGDYGVSTGSQTVTIPTTGSYTLTVATVNDGVDEADGSVTATVNASQSYTVSSTAGSSTVAILDDDVPEISITGGSGVTEGGNASFTLTASPVPASVLSVSVSVSQTGDYGASIGSQTVSIPTSGSYTLTVATVNDNVEEADGSVTATVGTGQGYTVSGTASAATVAVEDDDAAPPATPEISIAAGSGITEGGNASFTVTANPAPAANLDVTVAVAQSGDYGVSTGPQTVTIPTGGSYTLTVATANDNVDEADGSVTATVNASQGYTVSSTAGSATVAVADDDAAPQTCTPNLPSDAITVSEVKTWRGEYSQDSHVSRWNRVLAALGEDTGEEPMTADQAREIKSRIDNTRWDRTVRTLEAMEQCADSTDTTQTATPEISITGGSGITEGGNASFTVTANPAPTAALSVSVSVAQTGDYGVATGSQTVSIPTTGSYTLTVATSDDSVDEVDGSVTVMVSSGTGYTVSATAGSATVAVSDDDATPQTCTPTLPSDAITVSEVEAWRDAHSHDAAHVKRWNRVLAALGESTGETPMSADESRDNEDTFMRSRWDRVTRTLEALEQCADSTDTTQTVTPEISIAAGSGITEGGNASFTVTANPAPASDLDVTVAVTQSGDYGVSTGSQTVSIPTTGSYTLTVATSDDGVDEADGSVTVTVSSGTGYTVSATAGSATVAVADDDAAPPATPEISIIGGSGVTEGGNATFTVTANPAPTAALSVSVSVSQSGDYGVNTGSRTVTIPTTGSYTLTVATVNDNVDEADGSVTATVSTGAGYTVSTTAGSAAVAVADDDVPEISITGGSGVTEGGNATFTLTANPAPHAPLSVSVSVSQSGDFGVTTGSQTVGIPTTGSYTLTVATTNDALDEADGSVTATVSSGQGYTVSAIAGTATVAVADDDDPPPPDATPSLSVSDGSAREDAGVMEFTVSLSAASDKKVQVMAATTSFRYKTATIGDDFERTWVMLTFAPGETSKTVQVVILDDDLSEGDESFGMFLAYSPTNTPVTREHGEGLIIDDD